MASSNKKVPKQEIKNMDYQSDNSTAPKTTKEEERKEERQRFPKEENKKKLAKEDRGQEFPTLIQRVQEERKVQLINTRVRHKVASDEENMDL